MSSLRITVERRVVVSSRRFEDVLAAIDTAIGHPDMHAFWKEIAATSTYPEMEAVVQRAIGPSGLMEFLRFDHGQFLRKAQSPAAPVATPRIVRLVIGNPLIMMAMAKHVHDAGSYAPVTLLIVDCISAARAIRIPSRPAVHKHRRQIADPTRKWSHPQQNAVACSARSEDPT
jgi:hypothetical protein